MSITLEETASNTPTQNSHAECKNKMFIVKVKAL